MSALEPGLYRATVRGISDVIVAVGDDSYGRTMESLHDYYSHDTDQITDARPLIVLDLVQSPSTSRFAQAVRSAGYYNLADQIEAQTKPARIPEPEPGEHVTAGVMPAPDQPETFLHLRLRKLRNETPYDWACLTTGHCYMWDSLIDPTLIREGLS